MATYWKALTYEPKVQAVIEGSCTQTIRPGWNIEVGDMIGFHGWEGKPYRSKWTWRAGPYQVIESQHIRVYEDMILFFPYECFRDGFSATFAPPWEHQHIYQLARDDFIAPRKGERSASGEGLKEVLKGFYGKLEGQKFQVIKWKWKPQGFIDSPPPMFPELDNAEVIEL